MTETTPPIVLDPVEMRKLRVARNERIGRWVLPIIVVVLSIVSWDAFCVIY